MSFRESAWRAVGCHAFAWTFHNWYGMRRAILRAFGAKLTPTSKQRPSCIITHPWNLTMGIESAIGDGAYIDCSEAVSIGDYCTVSQYSKVMTTLEAGPAGVWRGPVRIEADGWVAADAMVFPGVTVGEGAILGSRATARANLVPWTIYGGEPLKALGSRPRFAGMPPE